MIAGVAASGVDIVGFSAYAGGLPVSLAPVITAAQTSLVLIVGWLVLKEPFTWAKLVGIGMIVGGVLIVQRANG